MLDVQFLFLLCSSLFENFLLVFYLSFFHGAWKKFTNFSTKVVGSLFSIFHHLQTLQIRSFHVMISWPNDPPIFSRSLYSNNISNLHRKKIIYLGPKEKESLSSLAELVTSVCDSRSRCSTICVFLKNAIDWEHHCQWLYIPPFFKLFQSDHLSCPNFSTESRNLRFPYQSEDRVGKDFLSTTQLLEKCISPFDLNAHLLLVFFNNPYISLEQSRTCRTSLVSSFSPNITTHHLLSYSTHFGIVLLLDLTICLIFRLSQFDLFVSFHLTFCFVFFFGTKDLVLQSLIQTHAWCTGSQILLHFLLHVWLPKLFELSQHIGQSDTTGMWRV